MHRLFKFVLPVLAGCSLTTESDPSGNPTTTNGGGYSSGDHHSPGSDNCAACGENSTGGGQSTGSGGGNSNGCDPHRTTGNPSQTANLYHLVPARSVGAEREIFGVDADGHGGLWLAYSTAGSYALNQKPVVELVHWDPVTRQRWQTFTYDDLWSPVSGLAVVQGQIWLNYKNVATPDHVIKVIDPTNGTVVRTLATTGTDVAAMCGDRVLVSDNGILALNAITGGATLSFSSSTVLHPNEPMGGISFTSTQQGVAWRPGEIWVGNWYMPMEIFSECGVALGKVSLPELQSASAYPTHHLAFDGGQLLVGSQGQLTWYDVR